MLLQQKSNFHFNLDVDRSFKKDEVIELETIY